MVALAQQKTRKHTKCITSSRELLPLPLLCFHFIRSKLLGCSCVQLSYLMLFFLSVFKMLKEIKRMEMILNECPKAMRTSVEVYVACLPACLPAT